MKAHEKGAEGLSFRFRISPVGTSRLTYPSRVSVPLASDGRLRILVAAVLSGGSLVFLRVSVPVPDGIDLGRIFFWSAISFTLAALPVRLPGGIVAHTTTAPLIAAIFDSALPNPFAVCWIAFFGTLELRDIRRQLPLWGTLYNRMAYVLSAFAAYLAVQLTNAAVRPEDPLGIVAQIVVAGTAFSFVNMLLAVSLASLRTNTPFARVWSLSIANVLSGLVALVPLGWLMAEIAVKIGLWAVVLFFLPLYLARFAFSKYAETRELFFG